MSLKRELYTLWDWLLNKGLFVASLIVNLFMAVIFAVCMLFVIWFCDWH